jgi:hypothetical protein
MVGLAWKEGLGDCRRARSGLQALGKTRDHEITKGVIRLFSAAPSHFELWNAGPIA